MKAGRHLVVKSCLCQRDGTRHKARYHLHVYRGPRSAPATTGVHVSNDRGARGARREVGTDRQICQKWSGNSSNCLYFRQTRPAALRRELRRAQPRRWPTTRPLWIVCRAWAGQRARIGTADLAAWTTECCQKGAASCRVHASRPVEEDTLTGEQDPDLYASSTHALGV